MKAVILITLVVASLFTVATGLLTTFAGSMADAPSGERMANRGCLAAIIGLLVFAGTGVYAMVTL